MSARPLEFTILTAARTGEAIGARWSEIDLDKGLWTVPGERLKSGRERRGPLSDRALAIISQLPDGEFLFAGRKPHKPLSQQAMLELMRDMRGKGATVHGFRSTFRDWAAKQTSSYPKELCEIALVYALSDKTEAAYRYDGEAAAEPDPTPAHRPRLIPPPSPGPEDGDAPRSVIARRRAHLRPAEAPSRSCRDRRRIGGGQSHRLSMLSGQSPPRPPTGPRRRFRRASFNLGLCELAIRDTQLGSRRPHITLQIPRV